MSYNGHEIFFLSLGNADCIYVRHWTNGIPTNILIDGGNKSDVSKIESFLEERGKDSELCKPTIHHLICTHSDNDHVGGLVPFVENRKFHIEQAWVHDLRRTNLLPDDNDKIMLKYWNADKLLEKIEASEQTRIALLEALEARRIPHFDPYAHQMIGPLQVLSPSREFFAEQYEELKHEDSAKAINQVLLNRAYDKMLTEETVKKAEASKDLGEGKTTPINEVSTVIVLPGIGTGTTPFYLFTGDVGPKGLDEVIGLTGDNLKNLKWLDVPHHGSRRSMRQDQIDHFAPETSLISAKGSVKHPSRKMVNALKLHGKVYSTHYSTSGSWLRQPSGTVPNLSGTQTATPLYDKE